MRKTWFVRMLLLLFIMMISISSYAEESITVSCYVGDPSDNEEVGEIEVFRLQAPAIIYSMIVKGNAQDVISVKNQAKSV